jgi:hypothetical protein
MAAGPGGARVVAKQDIFLQTVQYQSGRQGWDLIYETAYIIWIKRRTGFWTERGKEERRISRGDGSQPQVVL